ncbi:MAG: 16S rRNA processing protein RimM [Clostridia bacterium]|nr:16S rRNA processing protein RimM [Clostridia bacterium]
MSEKKMLEAGRLVTTHGIKGELKLQPWCDSAEFAYDIKTLYMDGAPLKILSRRIHKNALLITIEGVDTVEKAKFLVGKILYFKREDAPLPENAYFIADLMGLTVFDNRTQKELGKITDVLQRPANDVYVVTDGENEFLIPAAGDFIDSVDLDLKIMKVNTIEGMI